MADHYLAGPCEGISLHTEGNTLRISRDFGKSVEEHQYATEQEASKAVWEFREAFYSAAEGADNRPRYTTKRMHQEVEKATLYGRQIGLEEAAAYHDDLAAQHEASIEDGPWHERESVRHRVHGKMIRSLIYKATAHTRQPNPLQSNSTTNRRRQDRRT